MKKFNSHIYKNHISNIQKQKVLSTVLQKEQPTSNTKGATHLQHCQKIRFEKIFNIFGYFNPAQKYV